VARCYRASMTPAVRNTQDLRRPYLGEDLLSGASSVEDGGAAVYPPGPRGGGERVDVFLNARCQAL